MQKYAYFYPVYKCEKKLYKICFFQIENLLCALNSWLKKTVNNEANQKFSLKKYSLFNDQRA